MRWRTTATLSVDLFPLAFDFLPCDGGKWQMCSFALNTEVWRLTAAYKTSGWWGERLGSGDVISPYGELQVMCGCERAGERGRRELCNPKPARSLSLSLSLTHSLSLFPFAGTGKGPLLFLSLFHCLCSHSLNLKKKERKKNNLLTVFFFLVFIIRGLQMCRREEPAGKGTWKKPPLISLKTVSSTVFLCCWIVLTATGVRMNV